MKPLAFPLAAIVGVLLLAAILMANQAERKNAQPVGSKTVGLLLLLCAVFCWQLAVNPISDNFRDDRFCWPNDGIVIGVWAAFAGFYGLYRLFAPLSIHVAGFAFFGVCIAVATLSGTMPLDEAGWLLAVGAFVGSMVSYPYSVFVLVARFRRSARNRRNLMTIDDAPSATTSDQPET